MVQTLGGGTIAWEARPLPLEMAQQLRDRARAALERLEAEIRAAEAQAADE